MTAGCARPFPLSKVHIFLARELLVIVFHPGYWTGSSRDYITIGICTHDDVIFSAWLIVDVTGRLTKYEILVGENSYTYPGDTCYSVRNWFMKLGLLLTQCEEFHKLISQIFTISFVNNIIIIISR